MSEAKVGFEATPGGGADCRSLSGAGSARARAGSRPQDPRGLGWVIAVRQTRIIAVLRLKNSRLADCKKVLKEWKMTELVKKFPEEELKPEAKVGLEAV